MQNLRGSDPASPPRQNSESACRRLLIGCFHQRERPLSDFQNKVLQSCKGSGGGISQPCEWESSHELKRKGNHPALPYSSLRTPSETSYSNHNWSRGAVIVPSPVNDSPTMRPPAQRFWLPFCQWINTTPCRDFPTTASKISPSTQKGPGASPGPFCVFRRHLPHFVPSIRHPHSLLTRLGRSSNRKNALFRQIRKIQPNGTKSALFKLLH